MPKVPLHCHQVNCFQQGMLEFEGPMVQCFSRFPTVSGRKRGEKRKKDGSALFVQPYLSPYLEFHVYYAVSLLLCVCNTLKRIKNATSKFWILRYS